MIVDGFTFFNEFDMLECRLEYLYPHVDYFVISECNFTHSGKPKPLLYLQEQIRYKKYADKILYCPLILDDLKKYTKSDDTIDCWAIENQQRENIIIALEKFDGDTILLVSDVDEIPNENIFKNIQYDIPKNKCKRIYQKLFSYNLQCRHPRERWSHPYAIRLDNARKTGVEWNRAKWYYDDDGSGYQDGGWHLSYFMSLEQIRIKVASFAHQELNNEETFSALEKAIKGGYVLFDENMKMIFTQKQEFPERFFQIFQRFYPT